MIRTLLLTSMILVSGQVAAFPVLYYGDIQQELAGFKHETKPIEVLSLIEAHVRNDLLYLSYQERVDLIEQLNDLKQHLCATEFLIWPWLITAFAGAGWLINANDALNKGNSADQEAYFDACDRAGTRLMYFLICLSATLLVEHEYLEKSHLVQARNIEQKINNIIALLKQQ